VQWVTPLHEQIASELRTAIRTGRYEVGDPISSEARLAPRRRVSRAVSA
jgi:DNA-binding GntR family transcriptional regulator